MNRVVFSSGPSEWETPPDFYAELNREFRFTLDPAATPENAKCKRFFTKEDDGLARRWAPSRVFCNPPYGRTTTGLWVEKGYREAKLGALVVMLLPARTSNEWWHEWVKLASEIRFVKGRLKFVGAENSAPFPSAVVVFRPPARYW